MLFDIIYCVFIQRCYLLFGTCTWLSQAGSIVFEMIGKWIERIDKATIEKKKKLEKQKNKSSGREEKEGDKEEEKRRKKKQTRGKKEKLRRKTQKLQTKNK